MGVIDVDFQARAAAFVAGGREPPDNGAMEARVAKLEDIAEKTGERLVAIERDMAVVKATMVTKEEFHREFVAQTWRLITWTTSAGVALVGAAYYIARNVH